MSRIILERFIKKSNCLPNHNQVQIYFVQHLYFKELLHKQVNWDDKEAHGGVAHGHLKDMKRVRLARTRVQNLNPIVLSPKEHSKFEANALKGPTLASHTQKANQTL